MKMKWISPAVKRVAGICPVCGKPFTYPRKRRMHTDYEKEERNYFYSCKKCYQEREDVYNAQWEEYYNSRF